MVKKVSGWSERKRIIMGVVGVIGVFAPLYIGVIVWHTIKPLPEGIEYAGELQRVEKVE